MEKFYGEDLAYIHDTGYGDLARSAAAEVLRLLREEGITEGLVVDLGSGSGIFAGRMLEAGYDIAGVDYSEEMVSMAKWNAPGGKFETGSIFDYSIPPCRAVVSIGECLNYTFDDRNSMKTLGEVFERVYNALEPGGFFLFDILEPGVNGSEKSQLGISEGKDWTIFLKKEEDTEKKTLTRDITIFRREGELYRKSREVHTVNLYMKDEIKELLREAGFRVSFIGGYNGMEFRKGHTGFVRRK